MKKYFLLILAAMLLLLISCNSEGIGIFYQISEEVAQIDSNISELAVYQVVEVGTTVYARTGRSAWVQTASNWTNIGDGNYIYNIVEYNGGTPTLYGVINNDDNNLSEGKIMSYDGSNWNLVDAYNTDLTLFDVKKTTPDTYILIKRIVTDIGAVISTFSSTDLSNTIVNDEVITDIILDGASNTTTNILISSTDLFRGNFVGGLASIGFTSATAKIGDIRAIAVNAVDDYYLTTSSGQVYVSTDDAANWTIISDIDSEPVHGSLEVVSIFGGTKEYLIIGTDDGYYEMNITDGGSIVEPTGTTSVDNFSATYPDLAVEMVFEVYQSALGVAGDYFYLATSGGLWKRLSNGTFVRQ